MQARLATHVHMRALAVSPFKFLPSVDRAQAPADRGRMRSVRR